MSKMGAMVSNFLDSGGYHLGYNERELPDIDDMYMILSRSIKVWEYKGVTEEEYYGG